MGGEEFKSAEEIAKQFMPGGIREKELSSYYDRKVENLEEYELTKRKSGLFQYQEEGFNERNNVYSLIYETRVQNIYIEFDNLAGVFDPYKGRISQLCWLIELMTHASSDSLKDIRSAYEFLMALEKGDFNKLKTFLQVMDKDEKRQKEIYKAAAKGLAFLKNNFNHEVTYTFLSSAWKMVGGLGFDYMIRNCSVRHGHKSGMTKFFKGVEYVIGLPLLPFCLVISFFKGKTVVLKDETEKKRMQNLQSFLDGVRNLLLGDDYEVFQKNNLFVFAVDKEPITNKNKHNQGTYVGALQYKMDKCVLARPLPSEDSVYNEDMFLFYADQINRARKIFVKHSDSVKTILSNASMEDKKEAFAKMSADLNSGDASSVGTASEGE